MNKYFEQYFKCPERFSRFVQEGDLSPSAGYFRFGENAVCFGRCHGLVPTFSPGIESPSVKSNAFSRDGVVHLPFDVKEIIDGLRLEKYTSLAPKKGNSWMNTMYYSVRPLLPVSVRKHLQRLHLNGWEEIEFPHWPVDRNVDEIFETLMMLAIRAQKVEKIPFIWFWPDGASSCAIMTHDVETSKGREFCETLMDIDSQFGIKASFQVVPERRYDVPPAYLESIRSRGFEVGVQDLNHDGQLFRTHEQFVERAAMINNYGREWGARGFRAAVLYRRQDWFDSLRFSYDMSVPNVAHLDPQRGGCCTVMPYFIGDILELPVTTTQDYSLFNILRDYSIELWKRQIQLIMEQHGLISFIVHPDYITNKSERTTYESLLEYLSHLRDKQNVWIPVPGEVAQWWRRRNKMRLVEDAGKWHIEGEGGQRARVAYASEKNGRLEVEVEPHAPSLSTRTGGA